MIAKNQKKLKVLFITEFLPWPLNSGGRIRSFNILRQVSLRHEVTLISTCIGDEVDVFRDFVSEIYAINLKPKSKARKMIGALTSLFKADPYLRVYSTYHEEIYLKIKELLDTTSYNLIHLDQLDAAAYLPLCEEIPVYFDEHNYETKLIQSVIGNTSNFVVKKYLKQQCSKLELFEARALEHSDAIGVVSENDLELIAGIVPQKKVDVIPNGVDLEFFNIERAPKPRHLVSVGSLDWRPNVEGLLWFLDEVWPKIIVHSPDAIFNIVGRNPPDSLLERASDKVIVSGSVPDVRAYVTPASVFVVPLFSGGGTRLKVLEAMAMRIPVVSTSTGVEGIDCQNGEHVMISDDAEGFANRVLELLDDHAKAQEVAVAARKLVVDKYSWDSIGEKLDLVYKSLA